MRADRWTAGWKGSNRARRRSGGFRSASAAHQLKCVLAASIVPLCLPIDFAEASNPTDLMDSFVHLCIDNSLTYSAISGSAATAVLPLVDQKTMPLGGVDLRSSIWVLRRQPPAALIVTDETGTGKVTVCGVSDHITPLADMANELATRIRMKQLKTRFIAVNDVPLEDGSTVHIVSDPGGTSTAGFFLFRAAH
jgi:hypothetical protein